MPLQVIGERVQRRIDARVESERRCVVGSQCLQERRAKLLGLDSETKVSVSGSVKYEIVGVDPEALK